MYLNIKQMQQKAKEEGTTFTQHFMQIVSHEFIHQIITDIESDDASCDFDNICYRKYKRFKYWTGGVGGDKDDF